MKNIGYVYVLSNPALPGLYKVGSTQKTPDVRAASLYTTSLPLPFTVEIFLRTECFRTVEREIHRRLAKFRVSDKREFFEAHIYEIMEAFDDFKDDYWESCLAKKEAEAYMDWIDRKAAEYYGTAGGLQ